MPTIDREANGDLRVALEEYEAELLRRVAGEMKLLLDADIPHSDPVANRLFPAAYADLDEERDYRRMTRDDLHEAKRAALASVSEGLGEAGSVETTLASGEVDAWLTFLTDSRLALGTRLNVDEESMAREVDPDSPDAVAMSVLHWLGFLQESLLEHISQE
ncbi:MAG TPA: DUF2017 family protein [Actinomycetota bacterium]|nr:DUF2017 family protein [Actinomycetota bacterium]